MRPCLIVFLICCCLGVPVIASAESASRVYVSEVAWAGSSVSTADEWLELTNGSESSVDLSGWQIEGAATGGSTLTIPSGSSIASGATFLIANYGADDAKSSLAAAPQWVTTAVALSNDKLHLILRDASGAVVDEVGSASSPPAAGTTGNVKASMERLGPELAGTDPAAWRTAAVSIGFDSSTTDLGTPGTVTSPATTDASALPIVQAASMSSSAAAPNATAVRLSELLPSPPKGEDEWIELVDRGDIGELLDGWTIEDGKNVIARLQGLLQPWGRLVVRHLSGHLNNDGDIVFLKDVSGHIIDAVAYGGWEKGPYASAPGMPKQGESVARLELQDIWAVTSTPTPGEPNVILQDAPRAATKEVPVTTAPAEIAAQDVIETFSATGTRPTLTAVATSTRGAVAKVLRPPKTKAASAARYKGTRYTATVAVPLGVYGKTRMIVTVGNSLSELRLSRAPQQPPDVGTRVAFIAQKKADGSRNYLAANVNSLSALDDAAAEEPQFLPVSAWPQASGPVELKATVTSATPYQATVEAGGTTGTIALPTSAKVGLKPGDQISARGFVISDGSQPTLFLAAIDALSLLAQPGAHAPSDSRLPTGVAAGMTAAALGVGLLAYLRNERLKRLAAVQPEDELPLTE